MNDSHREPRSPRGLATRLVHAPVDTGARPTGAATPAIHRSTVFAVDGRGSDEAVTEGYRALRYPRYHNLPNAEELAAQLADLEGAEVGRVAASGMAAISSALLAVLDAGDHVLVSRDLYGGTHALVSERFPRLGIGHTFVDAGASETWAAAIEEAEAVGKKPRAFYVETVGNPLTRVADLEAVLAFAREHDLVTIVDSTFTTPIACRPAELGFDLVVHSATKYLNGHSDVLAGAVVGRRDLMEKVARQLVLFGGTLDAEACWLLQRGLKTLGLRYVEQSRNAETLARWLEARDGVERVWYPGLASHPDHERAARLLDEFGAMLAFELPDWSSARRFLDSVRLATHGASLGGLETLVVSPPHASHAAMDPEERRERFGIADGLVRVSVGIESIDDLIADFDQALG